MTSLSFVPSNALVAAFPVRRAQPSIRTAEVRARKAAWRAAWKAEEAAIAAKGFQPKMTLVFPSTSGKILGEPVRYAWRGKSLQRHSFVSVTASDRDILAAGPFVLLARRRTDGGLYEVAGVEVFEAENADRLTRWLDRAAAVPTVELFACSTGTTRIERAAIVADLTDKAPRASALVTAGKYDLRAIMTAAAAAARIIRKVSNMTWGAALSAALRDAWASAKATRTVAA